MGWITKAAIQPPIESVHFYAPLPTMGIFKGFGPALKYLPLAIPFGLLTVIGGINVNESARLAGDEYNTRDILLTEAIATLIAGLCGGVAQSTPYIGHPAYKNMGARIGYTLLTGICIGLGGFFGQISFVIELIPRAALAPILVFVALDIVIQSFHAVPKKHAAAVAFSFFPSIARMLGIELSKIPVIPEGAVPELQTIVALGNGFIITAMLWGGFLAKLIDRNLKGVTIYLLILAGLSFFGIIHSALGDGSMYLPWKLPDAVRQVPYFYSLGYFVLAVLLLGIHLVSSKFPDPELPEPH
jgi:AGZA family xanthine/uracil permease-like MFS transporter